LEKPADRQHPHAQNQDQTTADLPSMITRSLHRWAVDPTKRPARLGAGARVHPEAGAVQKQVVQGEVVEPARRRCDAQMSNSSLIAWQTW
jgi:hypothetical protein